MINVSITHSTNTIRPLIGISGCLAGQKVRYDGNDTLSGFYHSLSDHLTWRSFCPEVDAGLGVPRPPVQLVESKKGIKALGVNNQSLDVTQALSMSSETFWHEHSLSGSTTNPDRTTDSLQPLCGYVFKSRSPSCGFGSTPIFNLNGVQRGVASGLFANTANRHCVLAEETWLSNKDSQAVFISACHITHSLLTESHLIAGLYDLLSNTLMSSAHLSKTKSTIEHHLTEGQSNPDKAVLKTLLGYLTTHQNEKTALNRRFLNQELTSFWEL
ncbi:MAG: DUF523 domain-containing protein [Cellvibrionaceae bacterium]